MRFTDENTEGYSDAELDLLNDLYFMEGGDVADKTAADIERRRIHIAKTVTDEHFEASISELCTLCTRDGAGRHFTEWSRYWAALEAAGAITINRPEHPATGLPYGLDEWSLTVTEKGQRLVDDHPELHPQHPEA